MHILQNKISLEELKSMAEKSFSNFVKLVVDIRLHRIAIDSDLHADEETLLLENDSKQEDLWGINLYPEFSPEDESFIEYDSMINLRPSQNNRSRGVEDDTIRKQIAVVVRDYIT